MKFLRELLEEFGQDKCLRCGTADLISKEDKKTGICADCWTDKDGDVDEEDCQYMEVWVDGDDNILNEAAVRMFKRKGKEIKRMYRCTTGPKKGKPVSDPKKCATRKDPKKIRHGRKVARTKKGIRIRKSKIAKRTSMSRMVRRMNARLKGGRSSGTNKPASAITPASVPTPKKIFTKSDSTTSPVKTKKSKKTK